MNYFIKKFIKLDGILFSYYFYSRYKMWRNTNSLKKNFSHKYFVYYTNDSKDLLSQLSTKYGTNKGGSKTINVGNKFLHPHTYTDFYSQIFMFGRDKVLNLFECGIGTNNPLLKSTMGSAGKPGASLYMWRDYFPNATIYGGDIDKDVLFNAERIKTYHLDQTKEESIRRFFKQTGCSKFDVMIDDVLHTFEAGKSLFLSARHFLSETGVYIIEDISQNDYLKYLDFVKSYNLNAKFINLYRPNLPLGDNSLLVIEPKNYELHNKSHNNYNL